MPFSKGQSGNPKGRPLGSRETADIPIRTQKALVKALTERALQGDFAAQEALCLLLISQNREESLEEFN